jgi:hypothetical protein
MDILKYCFGIDPTKYELEKIRREKAIKRAKSRLIAHRFIYVNISPQRSSAITIGEENSDIIVTTV